MSRTRLRLSLIDLAKAPRWIFSTKWPSIGFLISCQTSKTEKVPRRVRPSPVCLDGSTSARDPAGELLSRSRGGRSTLTLPPFAGCARARPAAPVRRSKLREECRLEWPRTRSVSCGSARLPLRTVPRASLCPSPPRRQSCIRYRRARSASAEASSHPVSRVAGQAREDARLTRKLVEASADRFGGEGAVRPRHLGERRRG